MSRCARVVALVLAGISMLAAQTTPAPPAPPKGDVKLVGRIVSVLGDGVPAAEVWISDAQGQVVGRTVADGDGYYQVARLPFVPLVVHARGGDKCEGAIAVATNGVVRETTLVLEDGEVLRGSVLLANGQPAAGAAVLVTAQERIEPPFDWCAEVVADAKGHWTLANAPLRPLVVRAFVPGLPIGEQKVAGGRAGEVELRLAATPVAARKVQVRGMVAGQAVSVRCELTNRRSPEVARLPTPALEAVPDANGEARLWEIDEPHEVRVCAPAFDSAPVAIPWTRGVAQELAFTLTPRRPRDLVPCTRVTGRVVDDVGQPLAGVTVLSGYEGARGGSAVSGADGAFAIDVPANPGVLYEIGLGSREWRLGSPKVRLGEDGVSWLSKNANADEPLRLDAVRGGAIVGTLRTADQVPLAAARVVLRAVGAPLRNAGVVSATDAAGRLEIAALPPGQYTFEVQPCGAAPARGEVRVEAGQTVAPPALAFAACGGLSGSVTNAAGARVPSAAFMLTSMASVRGQRVPAGLRRQLLAGTGNIVLCDRHGQFRLSALEAGEWLAAPRRDSRAANQQVAAKDLQIEAGVISKEEFAFAR